MLTMNENNAQQTEVHTYELTTAHIDDWGDISYTTYGIRAVDGQGKTAMIFPDIDVDKASVQRLVDKCNEGELRLIHLRDVLEDYIGV